MIWFGRYPTEGAWARSSPRLAQEVCDELLPLACAVLPGQRTATVLATAALAERPAVRGRRATLVLSAVARGTLPEPIVWVGPPPPPDALAAGDAQQALPFLRFQVQSRSGRALAGLLVVQDGVYTLEELQRALHASFETGEPRQARLGVLASARRPLPKLRACTAGDLAAWLSVYRCDNRICASRGQEVLLRGTAGDLSGIGPFAVALPCPSCAGAWEQRWALTYVRPATNASLAGGVVVEYAMAPSQRRRSPIAGQLSVVVGSPRTRPWGEWSSPNIQQVPAGLQRFLRTKRPQALRTALREQPQLAGALLAGLVAPATLHAFVHSLRGLPPDELRGGIATGLANALDPRRTDVHAMSPGEERATHYHYIAYHPESFHSKLLAYGALDVPGRFLDVGCGLGEKVFLAYALGRFAQCDGLEYDSRMAAVAEFLFESVAGDTRYPLTVRRGDALAFEQYGDYDVVYMYRPFRDRALMRRLLERVTAQLRPGAMVMDVFLDQLALRKAADGSLRTVASLPSTGRAEWSVPVVLDEFLDAMGLGGVGTAG